MEQGGYYGMATPKQRALEVHVTDKILWIGPDAYPVQNIARARVRDLVPLKQKSPWGIFLKSLVKWVVIAVVATIVVAVTHINEAWGGLIWLFTLIFIVIAAVKLVIHLLRKKAITYYALTIETAGTAWDALVSDDRSIIEEIIGKIIEAINGLPVDFQRVVNNFINIGDNIKQYGNNNIGKVSS